LLIQPDFGILGPSRMAFGQIQMGSASRRVSAGSSALAFLTLALEVMLQILFRNHDALLVLQVQQVQAAASRFDLVVATNSAIRVPSTVVAALRTARCQKRPRH
jgi:hypothetical protein